ncbi:hypothetical protein JOD45_000188 [Scopulibacillus daqui]|uniref:Scaffold protein Nfu/NifU N-terminal domain-containing protein n=1 Tax=Scopulibacillus daqui TaxID=1469162 RepID=A0ABS2PVC8_9BACL|nr:NifU N-terminal domain-containing protein [Scopulibacillus daqui]MBM7643997.1 hypothetical protein [Scopulibacillus daqui]
MSIDVRADATPNPNAMKFTAAKKMFDGRVIAKKGDQAEHEIAAKLLSIEGVDNIFGYEDFVTVNKTFDADWEDLLPKIEEVFNSL